MTLSPATTDLVQDVTSPGGRRQYSPADHDRLDAFNTAIAKVQQRVFAIMAVASPEESEAIAEISWALSTNKPVTIAEDAPKELHKLARLFRARRRVFPKPLPWRPRTTARPRASGARPSVRPVRVATPRERRDASSSRSSGRDPGADGDPEPDPWALSLVDRAPFLWRIRALRCRLLEIREGVDR